jgi:hypothetical protein
MVCGWICLKLITVGSDGYRMDLKISHLVKCELKYDVGFLLVNEFPRHAMYV